MALTREFWTKTLVGKDNEHLYDNNWILQKGVKMDSFVDAYDVLHFTHKGTFGQLIKNPTYPLPRASRVDIPDSISLEPYATEQFILPAVELHALPYDKRKSVLNDQREEISNGLASEGVWNIGPYENTPQTPMIDASGNVSAMDGYRIIEPDDIVKLRIALNRAYPKLKNAAWNLVLDSVSFWTIVSKNEVIKTQMMYRNMVGKVNIDAEVDLYGFNLICDDRTAFYDSTNSRRMPYGSTPVQGTDFMSANAFVDNKSYITALGSTKFFDDRNDSGMQADMGSFLKHAYIGNMSGDNQTNLKYMGGILRKF